MNEFQNGLVYSERYAEIQKLRDESVHNRKNTLVC